MNYEYLSMDTLEENRKLLGEVGRLRNEKQELLETIDMITNDASEYVKRIDKAIEYIEELYEMAKEQDSDNVNLIDRLEIILNILRGENNEGN